MFQRLHTASKIRAASVPHYKGAASKKTVIFLHVPVPELPVLPQADEK
jgi:hypothetical protein